MDRAFPVVYASAVEATTAFYERLGFEAHVKLPSDEEPGYVGMRRGTYELAVVSEAWPREELGVTVGSGARFELFVYVDDVDTALATLGAELLKPARDMPWGERVAYVADPDGNPVALAMSAG